MSTELRPVSLLTQEADSSLNYNMPNKIEEKVVEWKLDLTQILKIKQD